jgi:hypothetical protein
MDPIAWGARPGLDDDENATCDAAELAEQGDRAAAHALLMEVLGTDLRCISTQLLRENAARTRRCRPSSPLTSSAARISRRR